MADKYKPLHVSGCPNTAVAPGTGRGCTCVVVNAEYLLELEHKAEALGRITDHVVSCQQRLAARESNCWDSLNPVVNLAQEASMETTGRYLDRQAGEL